LNVHVCHANKLAYQGFVAEVVAHHPHNVLQSTKDLGFEANCVATFARAFAHLLLSTQSVKRRHGLFEARRLGEPFESRNLKTTVELKEWKWNEHNAVCVSTPGKVSPIACHHEVTER
jgi:hypothetical protein